MFIHYSSNKKIYKDNSPDSIERTGINVETHRGKTTYTANTLTQFKTYKTLKGAENFMKKSGREAIAVEDNNQIIYLNSKAEKLSKNKR